ncbi:uncharacterized protein BO95DRAFT_146805 [Aspergillus brunneoviolaceus CBS 621.78]|uniref:Uncharacterized protein n=1 Tax=Aspergillus brunneoviolaceus CBS 621.78 TaxID=1450534 RepID=A0ACD1G7W1_9EURO|nr:hypothetical protein BO95DRAFT_146805 [Aspergillus brunneoviolaceus CBS 621.78]RAH45336.1 hypothetical protein BO95DRAFT_146805 [Aspergillus brunneoviolaceus CBS 621.78]
MKSLGLLDLKPSTSDASVPRPNPQFQPRSIANRDWLPETKPLWTKVSRKLLPSRNQTPLFPPETKNQSRDRVHRPMSQSRAERHERQRTGYPPAENSTNQANQLRRQKFGGCAWLGSRIQPSQPPLMQVLMQGTRNRVLQCLPSVASRTTHLPT